MKPTPNTTSLRVNILRKRPYGHPCYRPVITGADGKDVWHGNDWSQTDEGYALAEAEAKAELDRLVIDDNLRKYQTVIDNLNRGHGGYAPKPFDEFKRETLDSVDSHTDFNRFVANGFRVNRFDSDAAGNPR